MFDVIAVPVDGSEYGYKAADVAIEIAQKFGSKIAALIQQLRFRGGFRRCNLGKDYRKGFKGWS